MVTTSGWGAGYQIRNRLTPAMWDCISVISIPLRLLSAILTKSQGMVARLLFPQLCFQCLLVAAFMIVCVGHSEPKRGRGVVFYSLLPDGFGDEYSTHAACPVTAGTKWAANKWVWNMKR